MTSTSCNRRELAAEQALCQLDCVMVPVGAAVPMIEGLACEMGLQPFGDDVKKLIEMARKTTSAIVYSHRETSPGAFAPPGEPLHDTWHVVCNVSGEWWALTVSKDGECGSVRVHSHLVQYPRDRIVRMFARRDWTTDEMRISIGELLGKQHALRPRYM